MRAVAFLACCCLAACALAQAEVDRPVVLTGGDATARQITGLDSTVAPEAVLIASLEQSGSLRLAAPAQGAIWSVTVPGLSSVAAGTQLSIAVPSGASGPVLLQLNGGSASAVEWEPGLQLEGSGMPEGALLSVVFNGTAWQVMNGVVDRLRECPAGMAAVNDQYCIERAQRAAADFATAALACAAQGLRLCSWGEFVAACQRRTPLGLQLSSSDWEWTGNSANEENNVRVARLANCTASGHRNMTGPAAPSRCCFTR